MVDQPYRDGATPDTPNRGARSKTARRNRDGDTHVPRPSDSTVTRDSVVEHEPSDHLIPTDGRAER